MEVKGRVQRLLETKTGISANGNAWSRQEFVFEFFERESDRFADRVVLSLMNDQIAEKNLKAGDELVVGFGHRVREYNGKVYNELLMYKCVKVANVPGEPVTSAPQQQKIEMPAAAEEKKEDDLPF
jgi:hypothetical protein